MNEKKGELWESQAETVRLTGIPRRTLKEWIDQRQIAQSKSGYVNVIEVFRKDVDRKKREIDRLKERTDRGENPQQRLTLAQCRKVEAEASLKELELEQAKGELIDFKEAQGDLETAFLSARSKLLGIPSRLSLQLSGLSDPKAIAALLTEVIDESLEALATDFANSDQPDSNNDESNADQPNSTD
jgi:hypothetical protein